MKAADAGHRVLLMPLDRLIATLMKAKQENRLERQLHQLSYARVLIPGRNRLSTDEQRGSLSVLPVAEPTV